MSSRNFGILNKIKSKSIDKLFNSSQITTSYQYIENFDNVSEEDCIKLDNINREIYKKNMELFEVLNKKIEVKNAMFKIDTPPPPPTKPNNHEKYIFYKMRNISTNVRYQTLAVCYLMSKGYKLIFDKTEKAENEFEPFEAIELFQKLENISIDIALKNRNYDYYISSLVPQNVVTNNQNRYSNYINNSEYLSVYPKLSSSAPSTFPVIIPSAPSYVENDNEYNRIHADLPVHRHISGPPASHYIHH